MSSKRVLLINPWVEDFKLYDEWMHPLGLYLLAGILQREGHTPEILNLLERNSAEETKRYGTGRFEALEIPKPGLYQAIPRKYKRYGMSKSSAAERLQTGEPPDLVCITSAMTYWAGGLLSTLDLVREVLGEVPVVVGGIAASLIPNLLKAMLPSAEIFSGNLFRAGNHEFASKPGPPESASLLPGLRLAAPRYHAPILTSFGCPHSCSYCASKALQPDFIPRLPDVTVAELDFCIRELGIRDFAVYDDALLFRAEQSLSALEPVLTSVGEPVRIHTPNGIHAKFATSQVLSRMKNLGFTTIRIGYEAGTPRYRSETHRKVSQEAIASCVRRVFDHGWHREEVGVYVMAGLPGQDPRDVEDETLFIASLRCLVKPVFLSPVPGSRLFNRYAANFPVLTTNPLSHNDSYFVAQLPGWDFETMEHIKRLARRLNTSVRNE